MPCHEAVRDFPANAVLSRNEALSIGWTDPALARAFRRGDLVRLRRGFFARPPLNALLAVEAAARACRGSAISHRSAALVHGLPILGDAPALPELTVVPSNGTIVKGAHIHRATLQVEDLVETAAGMTTHIARTVMDIGRDRGTTAMVVSADAALHRHLIETTELEAVARRCWNWPGICRATCGLSLLDKRAESPLESLSRLAIGSMPIVQPELQPEIVTTSGFLLGKVDFYWDEYGVVGEADGLLKYRDDGSLTAEKLRQERLERAGLVVVRWGWSDVMQTPETLQRRLRWAFSRGLALKRSGLVAGWSVRRP